MPTKTAEANWNGNLVDGKGHLKTGSGALDVGYGWKSRSEDGTQGTNPEELIAAAHAGCFSMAFSHILAGAGYTAKSIHTKAEVKFDKVGDGFAITAIKLITSAEIPGISDADFKANAEKAKVGCPVSKALASVPLTLDATLKK